MLQAGPFFLLLAFFEFLWVLDDASSLFQQLKQEKARAKGTYTSRRRFTLSMLCYKLLFRPQTMIPSPDTEPDRWRI